MRWKIRIHEEKIEGAAQIARGAS